MTKDSSPRARRAVDPGFDNLSEHSPGPLRRRAVVIAYTGLDAPAQHLRLVTRGG